MILPETQRLKQRPPSSYCTGSRMLWGGPTTDALRGSAFTPMLSMLNSSRPALSRLRILSIALSFFFGKDLPLRWPRLFGQFFRFDEWSLCRG
jgi:hypothetical protein